MVRSLMNHKSSAVPLISVPTAEIVRSVGGIEKPLEMNLLDIAYRVVHNKLAHLGIMRSITVIKGHAKVLARTLNTVDYLLSLLRIYRHRLLGDNITAHLHSLDYVAVMGAVN